MDVCINESKKAAEFVTCESAFGRHAIYRYRMRPVFCPTCRRHYTALKPEGMVWAPTVVHVICSTCGGDGTPLLPEQVPR